ncbi:MAG: 30S ribosomal protein S4 [Deltaproteobacteria bacterium]|nr:30S ribosomal protein S4 [Deltaproteobacteria bacterium]
MARYCESVCRICRRENHKLFLKGDRCYMDKCSFERRSYPPGQHGQGRLKFSEYGLQLREKQKIKRMYGLLEKQFRNLFEKAELAKGITGSNLLVMLERRLDNVTYRSGFANSRTEARQLVRHGHFSVNGRKVNIPSYLVSKGDTIEVREKSRKCTRVLGAIEAVKRREIPQWLELDPNVFKSTVRDLPNRDDLTAPMEERLVVELYSK